MTIRTYDQSSQPVEVVTTDRTHRGRPLAIVYDLVNGDRVDTGYIVALCRDHDYGDRDISFHSAVPVAGVDYHGGEWLTNFGSQSDAYDDPREWITHNADLGEPHQIVERFSELLRRHWPTSQDVETAVAQAIVRAMPGDHAAGQDRIERIGDAMRWLAASLPMLDAAVRPDGRVMLIDRHTATPEAST